MSYCKVCNVCGHQITQIPIRRYDSLIMIEHYCAYCDTSDVTYETIDI